MWLLRKLFGWPKADLWYHDQPRLAIDVSHADDPGVDATPPLGEGHSRREAGFGTATNHPFRKL